MFQAPIAYVLYRRKIRRDRQKKIFYTVLGDAEFDQVHYSRFSDDPNDVRDDDEEEVIFSKRA